MLSRMIHMGNIKGVTWQHFCTPWLSKIKRCKNFPVYSIYSICNSVYTTLESLKKLMIANNWYSVMKHRIRISTSLVPRPLGAGHKTRSQHNHPTICNGLTQNDSSPISTLKSCYILLTTPGHPYGQRWG